MLANSIEHYDDALSRELTDRVAHANLEMRKLGYKPYVAPALSSGALTLLALLRGQWHYSSVYDGQVFMGCRNRLTPAGIETEALTLPPALRSFSGSSTVSMVYPLRYSMAFSFVRVSSRRICSAGGSVSASVSMPAGVRRLRQPMNTCPSYTEE